PGGAHVLVGGAARLVSARERSQLLVRSSAGIDDERWIESFRVGPPPSGTEDSVVRILWRFVEHSGTRQIAWRPRELQKSRDDAECIRSTGRRDSKRYDRRARPRARQPRDGAPLQHGRERRRPTV